MPIAGSRSLHGERGLKPPYRIFATNPKRRSLHGERGLKQLLSITIDIGGLSLPSRGAWIETTSIAANQLRPSRRSLHGERGLKQSQKYLKQSSRVAPFTGSVD